MKYIIGIIGLLIIGMVFAWYQTTPPTRSSEKVDVIIEKGDNYHVLAEKLKAENVIRSELLFKAYLRLNLPDSLQACRYELDRSWTYSEIVTAIEKDCNFSDEVVNVTIPEGRTLTRAAAIVADVIVADADEILQVWTSEEFIDEVIEKYDFANDSIKNNDIVYALEGYLFPSTYELLNVNVSPEYVAFRMLDQTARIYEKYAAEIADHQFSFHEILTLASIVEHEGILDEDLPKIASVFYNRLSINMPLQSCATLGYALGEWKAVYTGADTQVDHPYNTYINRGLPPGPGNMPGERSIMAVLNPATTNYYYFLANVCDSDDNQTYFSRTLSEHEQKRSQFDLSCE